MMGGDATAMMMAAAKLATTATGSATTNKVDDVIEDINKKKQSIRSDNEEPLIIGLTPRKSEVTPKQRWNWAYNKIIMQLNVSTYFSFLFDTIKIDPLFANYPNIAWPNNAACSRLKFKWMRPAMTARRIRVQILFIHPTARKLCSAFEMYIFYILFECENDTKGSAFVRDWPHVLRRKLKMIY